MQLETAAGAWRRLRRRAYLFQATSKALPFERSPENGFRCVIYPDKGIIPEPAFQPKKLLVFDFTDEKPLSEEVFQVYRDQFSYDKDDLDAAIEERDAGSENWVKERVTFSAAYDGSRMVAYLYLPKTPRLPIRP